MTDVRTRRNRSHSRRDDRAEEPSRPRPTMGDLSHVNPRTRETFGAAFQRGPAVADGGERRRTDADDAADAGADDSTANADDDTDTDTEERHARETMRDLKHTPPYGESVAEVWERGVDG